MRDQAGVDLRDWLPPFVEIFQPPGGEMVPVFGELPV